jgi:hypothetical protein
MKLIPQTLRNIMPLIKHNGLRHQTHSRARKASLHAIWTTGDFKLRAMQSNQEWQRATILKMQRGK